MTKTTAVTRRVSIAAFALASAIPRQAGADAAIVYSTDFLTGYYSSMQARAPFNTDLQIETTCEDAAVRASGELVYFIGRFGCDFIQVVDPAQGFASIQQFSTGNGTNPQDIEICTPTKAYVSLYETNSVLIVNPQTGQSLGHIDLAAFSDADGLAEVAEMVRVGTRVFVALQRLDRPGGYVAANPSLVAVIDCTTDQLVDANSMQAGVQAIALTGRNPFGELLYDPVRHKVVASETGNFGVLDGGAEFIDPVTLQAEGFFVTEQALGGDLNVLRLGPTCIGYAIITDAAFDTKLVRFSYCTGAAVETCATGNGFTYADVEIAGDLVYLADRDLVNPGVRVFQYPTCGEVTATPIDFGLPPQDLAFTGDCVPTAIDLTGAPRAFWLGANRPDPFNPQTVLEVEGTVGTDLVVDVIDVLGRRVALLWDGRLSGRARLQWDGRDTRGRALPSGTYFARARSAAATRVERMTLVR